MVAAAATGAVFLAKTVTRLSPELLQWDQWKSTQPPDRRHLMREDGMHSLQWYLVVISEAHPTLDRQVRVVTHYTARGTHKRPASP